MTTKQKVKQILLENRSARNSDHELRKIYYKQYFPQYVHENEDGFFWVCVDVFKIKGANPETLRRDRQVLQQGARERIINGKGSEEDYNIVADKYVLNERFDKASQIRRDVGQIDNLL